MGRIEDEELGLYYEPSFELKRKTLDQGLEQLGLEGDTLAIHLHEIGDLRNLSNNMRSIRQMLVGRKEVPNELIVILELLKRRVRRIERLYGQLKWREAEDGSISTEAEGFAISLLPKSRGRYHIHMRHLATGFSPAWPRWQHGIEKAKFVAAMKLDDALSHLDELVEEGKISRSQLVS
jgi:hypothetical protein